MSSKDEMVALIENNFMRRKAFSSPTFELIHFLFACVCFHYTQLDMNMYKNHSLRASPIFIAVRREKHIHEFALTIYPWTSTTYTPYFKGIPLHIMLVSEIESLNAIFEQQTIDIVQETRIDFNERNVCGVYKNLGAFLTK